MEKKLPKKFYISIRRNPDYGIFVTIADIDVVKKHTFLKNMNYDKIVMDVDAKDILKTAVSIIFYGDNAIELGIKLKYVHPDAVGWQKGVKTAIYIKTF